MHLPHPHLSAGSLLHHADRRRLDAAVILAGDPDSPHALPLQRQLLDAVERCVPAEFFTAAPFARLAVYLSCGTASAAGRPPAPLLLEDGWLEISWPFDCVALGKAPTRERDVRLELLLHESLLFVAKRFTLPCESLRRARHGALARLSNLRRKEAAGRRPPRSEA